jgi:hypothetical protein
MMISTDYSLEDYIQQALEQVETWDPPPEQFCDAVNAQVRLTAGIDSDYRDPVLELRTHTALRF